MATLQDGLYHIRFIPSGVQTPMLGGLYATATEIGEPILAEAQGDKGLQTWQVTRSENGKYIITQPGFQTKLPFQGPGPVLMGWSLANPSLRFPGGNILFKVDYAELELIPEGVNPEGPNPKGPHPKGPHPKGPHPKGPHPRPEEIIYGIKVPNPEGIHRLHQSCDFYVTENDHTVASQAYWSYLHWRRPHPHWQFIPAKSE